MPDINTPKNILVQSFFKLNEDIGQQQQLQHQQQQLSSSISKYMQNVMPHKIDIQTFIYAKDICQYCFKGELIPLEDEGVLMCNQCFKNVKYLIENDKYSNKEPPKEVSFYAYKRINHWKEVLSQFQGKETTTIPPEVIIKLKNQIKKERLDYSYITNNKTREILRKLGYNSKYYEHIPYIKHQLGIKPHIMNAELEELLVNLFYDILEPYAKYCPDYRENFLNYHYTLYKLCQLLGEHQYLPDIHMIKDRSKLIEHDTIWKKICQDMDWEFIPTTN